jgi:hypothetical protein
MADSKKPSAQEPSSSENADKSKQVQPENLYSEPVASKPLYIPPAPPVEPSESIQFQLRLRRFEAMDAARKVHGRRSIFWSGFVQKDIDEKPALAALYFEIFRHLANAQELKWTEVHFRTHGTLFSEQKVLVLGHWVFAYLYGETLVDVYAIACDSDGGGGDSPDHAPPGPIPGGNGRGPAYYPAPKAKRAPMHATTIIGKSTIPPDDLTMLLEALRRRLLSCAEDPRSFEPGGAAIRLLQDRYAIDILGGAVHGDAATACATLRDPLRRLAKLVSLVGDHFEPADPGWWESNLRLPGTVSIELQIFGVSREDRTVTVTLAFADAGGNLVRETLGGGVRNDDTLDDIAKRGGDDGRVMKSGSDGAFACITALICKLQE